MFQQLGSNCTTVSQVIESEDKTVFKAIQDGIDRYNTHHLISNAQKVCVRACVRACMHAYVRTCTKINICVLQVQKWTLLDTDFTIAGGELGMCCDHVS